MKATRMILLHVSLLPLQFVYRRLFSFVLAVNEKDCIVLWGEKSIGEYNLGIPFLLSVPDFALR